jgi:hypothetical protein
MKMTRLWLVSGFPLVAAGALFAACSASDPAVDDGGGNSGGSGGSGGAGGNLPHTLESILITPLNAIVELDVNVTGVQPYVATAQFADGTSEDVTEQVTWTVTNDAVGAFNGANLEIPQFAAATAEVSLVKANFEGVEGTAQITVVAYRKSGPQQDFFFILPFEDPAGNQEKPLDFSTAIPALDVFFLMDVTGSMGGAISNLQNGLTSTVVPGITSAVADSQFGVGAFSDFPIQPYGGEANGCGNGLPAGVYDQPFYLLQTITSDQNAVTAGVNALSVSAGGSPIGCGWDGPESQIEGYYQAATGEGLMSPSPTNVPSNNAGVGGVAFREGTMPVIVGITDIASHAPGEPAGSCGQIAYDSPLIAEAHTRQQAKDALNAICARVVGISNNPGTFCSGQPDLEDFATATGARVPPEAWDVPARPANCPVGQCCTALDGAGRAPDADGLCPVVFQTQYNGSGLGTHIVTGIQMLTRYATFEVQTEKEGEDASISGVPLPAGTSTADFIKSITPAGFTLPPPPPALPNPTFDSVSFQGVTPGTIVSFDVVGFNDFVQPTDQALIYKATIRVNAGGCTALDEREVFILVPPDAVAPPM